MNHELKHRLITWLKAGTNRQIWVWLCTLITWWVWLQHVAGVRVHTASLCSLLLLPVLHLSPQL